MAHLSTEAREGMQSDIAQMDAIIGQFLDFAKPTEAATFAPVDLSGMLADVAHTVERIPNMRVSTSIAPDIHVLGNSTDLRRVLNNLVENARRYARTPGEDVTDIEIDCQVKATGHGRRAVLTLQDHGPGVPEDQIAQLLKPFTRLDTARGQANGAGLGLAIVERVLTRHNAELSLQNRPGGGLRIQITLPLAR
jgi:two-component system osmolarity sensor histidine kinase EnvZ